MTDRTNLASAAENGSSSDEPVSFVSSALARRKGWVRFAWLVLLAQGTLFWEGCHGQQTLLSVGVAGPALTIGYDGPMSSELIDFSPGCFAGNALAVIGAVLLLAYGPAVWLSRLSSHTLLTATVLLTALFNSVLYFAALWLYAVHWPVLMLAETFFRHPTAHSAAVLGTFSRLYFLACIALMWGVLRLIQMLLRRYFFVAADRWQFSLAGMLVLMVVFGTGLGLMLRLLTG